MTTASRYPRTERALGLRRREADDDRIRPADVVDLVTAPGIGFGAAVALGVGALGTGLIRLIRRRGTGAVRRR